MRAGRKKSMKFAKAVVIKKEGESMERKIGSAILKGSMLLAAMFLMEGSVYPVQAEEYSTFGTFSPDHSGHRSDVPHTPWDPFVLSVA